MTSQGLMPAMNAGLSGHRPGKLNNSKWPPSKFSRAMTTKTSILAGIKLCDVIMHKFYSQTHRKLTTIHIFISGTV